MAPAEALVDRLWRLHRHAPAWRRWLGGTLLVLVTIVIVLAYIALLLALVVGVVWAVTQYA